jgi:hypothetical protein
MFKAVDGNQNKWSQVALLGILVQVHHDQKVHGLFTLLCSDRCPSYPTI